MILKYLFDSGTLSHASAFTTRQRDSMMKCGKASAVVIVCRENDEGAVLCRKNQFTSFELFFHGTTSSRMKNEVKCFSTEDRSLSAS